MMRGRFISLEGGEGVGKSTQTARLADVLRSRGLEAVTTREPGGTAGAEAIRDLLLGGDEDRWNARCEALLFAAARGDHVAKVIEPALARGAWVMCDRFVDSTRAYQGGGGGLGDSDIMALHAIGSRGILPDRTLLLALPADAAAARLAARDAGHSDRMGAKPADYHARLAERFVAMASAEPLRWRQIDANAPTDVVTARLVEAIADMVP